MAKRLDFKDFLNVDYAPGMPDLIKRNAKKRKHDAGAGTNAEYSSRYAPHEKVATVSEATPPGGKPIPALTPDQAHKWLDQGKHAKSLAAKKGMGWETKTVTVKQLDDVKGKQHHIHAHQYTEEVELDEYNTKSNKAIVINKDNKPVAIYSDLKSAQKDYYGKDGHAIGMRSHSAAERIRKANPGIKIVESVEEIDEALTPQQRRARARLMKRFKSRIELGKRRAERRFADPERLKKRARRAARKAVLLKITKNIPKDELTFARRQEIEKRLDTPQMKARIEKLAIRMLPKVRKSEIERKRGSIQQDDKK